MNRSKRCIQLAAVQWQYLVGLLSPQCFPSKLVIPFAHGQLCTLAPCILQCIISKPRYGVMG